MTRCLAQQRRLYCATKDWAHDRIWETTGASGHRWCGLEADLGRFVEVPIQNLLYRRLLYVELKRP
ncbi:hypothetical protein LCGC14_0827910 [marine sediment metagenome]|uniref:Uncharacterized protein n=1 Tax=marine sediment metagenome TaxID=412755 RepID=A0A0F9S1N6_9ZZZZ